MKDPKFGGEDPAATKPDVRGTRPLRHAAMSDLLPEAATVKDPSLLPGLDEKGVMLSRFSPEKKLEIYAEFEKLFQGGEPVAEQIERFERNVLLAHHPRLLVIETLEDWAEKLQDHRTQDEVSALVQALFTKEDQRVHAEENTKLAALNVNEAAAVRRIEDALKFLLYPAKGPEYFRTAHFQEDVCDFLERPFVTEYPDQLIRLLGERSYTPPEVVEAMNAIRIELELERVFVREIRDFFTLHREDLAADSVTCQQEMQNMATTDLLVRHPRALNRAFLRLRKEHLVDGVLLDKLHAYFIGFQS